jgi:hypothetical protein
MKTTLVKSDAKGSHTAPALPKPAPVGRLMGDKHLPFCDGNTYKVNDYLVARGPQMREF